MFMFQTFCVIICWVRINQRVGYELIESGYEMSEPGYESSGYERSMGTKRPVRVVVSLHLTVAVVELVLYIW